MKQKIIILLLLSLLLIPSDALAKRKDKADKILDSAKQEYSVSEGSENENLKDFADLYTEETLKEEATRRNSEVKEYPVSNVVQGSVEENVILSLKSCIERALENNPSIMSALYNTQIAKTKIGQAWSAYFPQASMTNGYSRNRMLVLNFPVPMKEYNYYNGMTINFSMLLFDFGKTKATADMYKKGYDGTLNSLQEMINSTIFEVSDAYYQLLFAIHQKNVYEDTVNRFELNLKQARGFYAAGTRPKIDVITAEYNLSNAKMGLIKSQNDLKVAYANLNNAMGLPDEKNYKIMDNLDNRKYDLNLDNLLKQAYESRPELLAQINKAESSKMLIRLSRRAFLPDFELFGNYQLGGGTRFSDEYGYQFGAQFRYGTTNFYLLKKQYDEAKATYRKDLADLEVKKQDLNFQVKQAYLQVVNSEESIPVAIAAMKQAKEQYELAEGRYKAGVGNQIEYKDSENNYKNSALEYYQTLLTYNVSVANLERIVGVKISVPTQEGTETVAPENKEETVK